MNRWRNCSTAVSSVVRRAKVPQNYRARPSFTSVSFLADEEKRYSTPANANNPGLVKNPSRRVEYFDELNQTLPATKNHHCLGDFEDESNAKIFSLPDSETGQQSSPLIQLKLMRRQPQQGNSDRVLVQNDFDTTSATVRSKFPAVLLQLFCANGQMHN